MMNIQTHFGNELEWAVVAQEKHQDGGLHLHMGLSLKTRYNSKDPKCLDDIALKHGKYEAMRNQYNWIQYICKEDSEPLVWVNYDNILVYHLVKLCRACADMDRD